jgi:hypothetical protein
MSDASQNGGDNGGGAANPADTGAAGNGVPQGDVTGAGGDAAATGAGDDPSTWTYDVKFPDAFGLKQEQLEGWTNALREAGIKPEQAAKIAEFEIAQFEASVQAQQGLLDGYAKAVENDPFLSENWELTTQRMEAGLNAVGVSPEFKEFLASPDGLVLSAIPEVMKAFAMLGKMTSNDTFEGGRASNDTEPAHRSWYANTTPQTKKG